MSQGTITFYLESRYSFAQRTASAATSRYAFDVRDGNGNHLFYFLTQVSGGYLFFNYGIAGTAQYTYAQPGTENTLFGSGVIMQVQMTWSAGVTNLFLNGTLVKSAPIAAMAVNWTAGSVFDLGAFEYQTYGGFYGSDDAIDEFTVNASVTAANPAAAAPTTAPANRTTQCETVLETAGAIGNEAVTGSRNELDGTNSCRASNGPSPTQTDENRLHELTGIGHQ
jgi:hypothetical protein